MAVSGSSPAPAAPVVGIVVDPLPALAAPSIESAQRRFTLADALKYRIVIYERNECARSDLPRQVRKVSNAATHYYRKMFTLKDGTALINCLEFSHIDDPCTIICLKRADDRPDYQFRFDKKVYFRWKALVACGLTTAQLIEFLSSPITSVKFVPSSTSEEIYHVPGNAVSNSVTWSWIFEREDGTWIALEPGISGTKMNFQIAALADHPCHTGIVLTPRGAGGRDAEASYERVWEAGLAILYGGLEDEV